jgi:hypothetical protein
MTTPKPPGAHAAKAADKGIRKKPSKIATTFLSLVPDWCEIGA